MSLPESIFEILGYAWSCLMPKTEAEKRMKEMAKNVVASSPEGKQIEKLRQAHKETDELLEKFKHDRRI